MVIYDLRIILLRTTGIHVRGVSVLLIRFFMIFDFESPDFKRVGLDHHSSKDVPELDDKEEELNDNNAISFMIVKFLSRDFIMKKS